MLIQRNQIFAPGGDGDSGGGDTPANPPVETPPRDGGDPLPDPPPPNQ